MRITLTLVSLAFAAALAPALAAEGVPQLNVEPSCRSAAKLEQLDNKQFQACLDDEANAKAEIGKEWSTFPERARTMCLAETNQDGSPSYVELLECLRLARDSKKYPAN